MKRTLFLIVLVVFGLFLLGGCREEGRTFVENSKEKMAAAFTDAVPNMSFERLKKDFNSDKIEWKSSLDTPTNGEVVVKRGDEQIVVKIEDDKVINVRRTGEETDAGVSQKCDLPAIYKKVETKMDPNDITNKVGKPAEIKPPPYPSMGETWIYRNGKEEVRIEVRNGKAFKVEHVDAGVDPPTEIQKKSDEIIIKQ